MQTSLVVQKRATMRPGQIHEEDVASTGYNPSLCITAAAVKEPSKPQLQPHYYSRRVMIGSIS